MKNVILTIVVISFVICLFLGLYTLVLYVLRIFSLVEIDSFKSAAIFTLCIMVWAVPFEVIGLFDRFFVNGGFGGIVLLLLQFVVFTFYLLWLDKMFSTISFSSVGMVCYIIIIALLVLGTMIGGEKVKEQDEKNKTI